MEVVHDADPLTGLPSRRVQHVSDNAVVYTVSQGASHLQLFENLQAIKRMMKVKIKSRKLRPGFTGEQKTTAKECDPSTCTIDPHRRGVGYRDGVVVCAGRGTTFEASITASPGGYIETLTPLCDGSATGWALGYTFTVQQDASTTAATGVVASLRRVRAQRVERHKYQAGDAYCPSDIPQAWQEARGRVRSDVVRYRALTCHCTDGCPVFVEETFDWGGVAVEHCACDGHVWC
jgi:hypothetical protein